MIKIIYLIIPVLISAGFNTNAIADEDEYKQCQSILSNHANQQNPSFTKEEKKILQTCDKTENWCSFYGSNIANCQNNLALAVTTETPTSSITKTPISTPTSQVVTPPSPSASTPAAQQKQDINTTPINNNNKTTTTTPSKPKNNQTEPSINWF